MNKTSEDFFKKYTSHFIWKVCVWEGVEDRTELQYIDPHSYDHQRCVFLVLLMLNRRPGGPLCWLSLLHLITNWSGLQTPSGVPMAPLLGGGFPYHFLSPTSLVPNSLTSYLTEFNRPLNLWNSMFDCHQAKITVMLFTGHSLPVHQSMSVPWDFYLVLFFQPSSPPRFLSITGHRNVSLPSGASLWNGIIRRVEGQYTTYWLGCNNLVNIFCFGVERSCMNGAAMGLELTAG